MPHSSACGKEGLGGVPALCFDLVEPSLLIEAPTFLRENAELRRDGWVCGSFGEVAAAIWLEERKSENEEGVCEVGIGWGLPPSEEWEGLSAKGVSIAVTTHSVESTYQPHSPHCPRPHRRLAQSGVSWRDQPHLSGSSDHQILPLVRLGTYDPGHH
jgi:hypothetical protein